MSLPTTTSKTPATDEPELSHWKETHAAMIAARDASARYDAAVYDPLYERERAFLEARGLGDLFPADERVKAAHVADNFEHQIPSEIHDRQQELVDAYADIESALMRTPAPNLAALRWKLEQLLVIEHEEVDGGSTPAWSAQYARQTMADIARLLPEGW